MKPEICATATPIVFGDARLLSRCARQTGLPAPKRIISEIEWAEKCSTIDEPAVLDGMETLLHGWGCEVIKAPDLANALTAAEASPRPPNGLLVDYHLDHGNGIDAIAALRTRFGDLPAILITADRSPAVRDEARERNIQLLHKPVKPAALRALLAQWRVMRVAAAE